MKVEVQQIVKSSFIIIIGILIGVVNRLFLFPLALNASEIGMFQVLISIAIILSYLSLFGITLTIPKFFEYFKKQDLIKPFLGYTITISYSLFIITSIIFLVFNDYLIQRFYSEYPNLTDYVYPILFFSFILINFYIFSAISYVYKKVAVPTFIHQVLLKSSSTILLILVFIGFFDSQKYFELHILSYTILTALLLYYVKTKFNLQLNFNFKQISQESKKKLLKYSSFIYFGSISSIIAVKIDALMLASLENFDNAGIYTIAFFMGSFIESPKKSVSKISIPILSKEWENNNIKKINQIYEKTSINQALIAIPLFLLIYLSLENIFYLIPHYETYVIGKNVVLIIGFSKVIDLFFGTNAEILKSSNKYRWDLFLIIFFIFISIGLNYFLIPIYSLDGAAFATMISVSLYNLFRFLILYHFYKLNPFTKKSFILLIIFILFGMIIFLLKAMFLQDTDKNIIMNLVYIGIKSLCFVSIFGLTVYKLNISDDLNKIFTDGINRIKSFSKIS